MNLYLRLLGLLLTFRRHRRVELWDGVTSTFRVRLTDIDTVGHMNNAKYLALMDLGRVDLMLRSRLLQDLRQRGWYVVVAAQTIRYRRSLKPRQRFELRTRVLGTDERAVYFDQSFFVGEELYARAVVQCRFLRKAGGSVLPEELLAALGGTPGDLELPEWVRDWAVGVRQAA